MSVLLLIVWVIFAAVLLIVVAIRPVASAHSWFELKRLGNEDALLRERHLRDVYAVRRLLICLFLISLTVVGLGIWQSWGVLAASAAALLVIPISRISYIKNFVMRLYSPREAAIIKFLVAWPIAAWFGRYDSTRHHNQKIESTEQLLHLVDTSGHILTDDQRTIIRRGLAWPTTHVKDIMVARKDIVSLKHTELIGPLVLDDLHKSGHNRFPVIRGNLDEVIGVLDITDMLEVSSGRISSTAEQAMSARVLRIDSNEPLPNALTMLQKSHQYILVVVDDHGKTVGLVTLADITSSLLGKTGVK